MSVTSKVESTISNTSFKLTAFLTSLTVLFFYPDAVDPFNSVKMWLLILGTSWLFGYLVHFGMKSLKNRNSNEKSSLFFQHGNEVARFFEKTQKMLKNVLYFRLEGLFSLFSVSIRTRRSRS